MNEEKIETGVENEVKEPKLNRAQRRAKEKMERKMRKRIEAYIKKHPEAVKVELDDEAVAKVEEQEKAGE